MVHYLTTVHKALKEVYSRKSYVIISILTFFMIFSFNAVITNYKLLIHEFSLLLFLSLLGSTTKTITAASLVMLLIMSVLAGIVISMSIFLIKRQMKGSGVGISSIIVSLIAPSCPSCALGLLSILGLGGFIAFLPFKGIELGVTGIIIMIISIVYLSQKITANSCTLK